MAILHSSQDPLKFSSEWYSCRRYKEAYSHTIRSIPDTDHWLEMQGSLIKPPPQIRAIERTSKNRKRVVNEERRGEEVCYCKMY